MMPLNLSLRRLLRKNIPQVPIDEIDRYESLIALRHQLIQEKPLLPIPGSGANEPTEGHEDNYPPPKTSQRQNGNIDSQLEQAAREANAIFYPFKAAFEATLKLWVARRQYALRQGNLLQIPATKTRMLQFGKSAVKYRIVQAQTAPPILWNRLCHSWEQLSFARFVLIAILAWWLIWLFYASQSTITPPERDKPSTVDQRGF